MASEPGAPCIILSFCESFFHSVQFHDLFSGVYMKVRVARKIEEAVNICSFELTSSDGSDLPAFSAGSHIDVTCPNGLVRQYSLCNSPAESHRYLIAVLKDPLSRGGSRAMHERVHEGSEIEISAPKNHFALAGTDQKSLLFAGGIGITPILCMAEWLSATGAEFDLHYAGRSRSGMAFQERIQASAFSKHIHLFAGDENQGQRVDIPSVLASHEKQTHIYVCGPQGYMDAVLASARSAGWLEEQLHYEFFNAEVKKLDSDGSFNVKLASSGKFVVVTKEQTVAQALANAGVDIPTSCEQGVCGTCLTRVLAGECDHRDMFLLDEEKDRNDQFLPCVSRARSDVLVLDI
jgi:vanillate O-demethylase ferredoxin subunit